MHHLMKALQSPPRSGLSTTLSLPQNNAPHQMPFYEPYEHVLCHPPPRLRLYTPTQLALAPGPPFLFLGKRTVGAWGGRYLLLTDRKHLSFVPPALEIYDITRQKNHNRKVLTGRVASETSLSEED